MPRIYKKKSRFSKHDKLVRRPVAARQSIARFEGGPRQPPLPEAFFAATHLDANAEIFYVPLTRTSSTTVSLPGALRIWMVRPCMLVRCEPNAVCFASRRRTRSVRAHRRLSACSSAHMACVSMMRTKYIACLLCLLRDKKSEQGRAVRCHCSNIPMCAASPAVAPALAKSPTLRLSARRAVQRSPCRPSKPIRPRPPQLRAQGGQPACLPKTASTVW